MFMRPQGYGTITDPDRPLMEADSFTCFHCNRVELVPAKCPPEDMGGFCKVCAKLICRYCLAGPCIPWQEKLDRIEARNNFLRSVGMI